MKVRFLSLVMLLVVALSLAVAPVMAHEGREVGEYVLVFGWKVEPAYSNVPNGPELEISLHDADHDAAFPDDIEVSLQAEVTFGPESIILNLEPSWQEPGRYTADLIPTLPGDYSFRIFGTIGDTEVDEVFNSADGEFSSIEPGNDILFPASASLEARIAALEARIAELEARLAGE